MALPTPRFFRVTHKFLLGTNRLAFTTYCVFNELVADAEEVAEFTHATFGAGPASIMTNEWSMVETHVKQGPDDTGPQHVVSAPVITGTAGPPTASAQVAFLFHKNTATGGRRGRGRFFLPGVAEAVVGAGGNLTTAQVAINNAQAAEWFDAMDANDMPLQLEHDRATEWVLVGGQPRRVPVGPAAPTPTPLVSVTADARVGTQRRRNR